MWKQVIGSLRMLVVLTIITGVLYPLAMTGLAQALFPWQANGSIIARDGKPIGSRLIGQNFSEPGYFHGRPSAAGKDGYDATASSSSNLGPTNKKLVDTAAENASKIRAEHGLGAGTPIPADLVLASGSGLDPDISPAAAYLQVERVAKERGLPSDEVRKLVAVHVKNPALDILGEARVNVLELNLALDTLRR